MTESGTHNAAQAAPADENYLGQVLERYEARRASFIKQSTIFFIFVFSFLAFVLVPMVSLKFEADEIGRMLERKTQDIEALEVRNEEISAQEVTLNEQRAFLNGELTSLNTVKSHIEADVQQAQISLSDLQERLGQIRKDQADQQRRVATLKRSQAAMTSAIAMFNVNERVDELRSWFRQTASGCSQVQNCRNDRQAYYASEVRMKLQADWDRDFDRIDREIVDPLRAAEGEIAGTIADRLIQARAGFEANLDDDPSFWQTINEKEAFINKLALEWEEAFASIQSIVHERSAEVERGMAELESTMAGLAEEEQAVGAELTRIESKQAGVLADLEDALTREQEFNDQQKNIEVRAKMNEENLAQNQKEIKALRKLEGRTREKEIGIEARLSEFQSPFGTFPVGFQEAALAFPFILAACFLVCASLLASLIRLRHEYHVLIRSGTSLALEAVTRRVALVVPLWLDPALRSWRNVIVVALLILPIPAFALTVSMMASDWLLRLEADQSGRVLIIFYDALYAAGLLLMGVGVWRVFVEWKSYRKAMAGFS